MTAAVEVQAPARVTVVTPGAVITMPARFPTLSDAQVLAATVGLIRFVGATRKCGRKGAV